MESISKGSAGGCLLSMGLGELVGEVIRAPMHGGAESLRSSSELTGIANVSTAFHDINLTTSRPLSVFIVTGKCPDGGPEPISLGEFGLDLHSAVLEVEGVDGGELATHHWVDVVVSVTGPAAAVEEVPGALISRGASPEFIGEAGADELGSNLFFCEDGLDVEDAVLGEGGGAVVVIDLELPVASSCERDIVTPLGKIKEIKVVLKDDLGACEEEDAKKDTNYLHISRTNQMIINLQNPFGKNMPINTTLTQIRVLFVK